MRCDMAKLMGAQRMVLQAILDASGDILSFVEDSLLLKGPIPGNRGSLLRVRSGGFWPGESGWVGPASLVGLAITRANRPVFPGILAVLSP
jgi:hypothetical protein